MTANLEAFILCNMAFNAFLLWSAGKLCAMPVRMWKLGLAALFGCVYGVVSLSLVPLMQLWPFRILAAAAMGLFCFAPCSAKQFFPALGLVAVCTFLLGGTGFGLMYLLGFRGFGAGLAAITLSVSLGALALLIPRQKALRRKPLHAMLTVQYDGVTKTLPALLDTGNRLTLGNVPVIVVPAALLDNAPCTHAVSCQTVAGRRLLTAFLPDRLWLNERPVPQAYIAVSHEKKDRALVPYEIWIGGNSA